MSKKTKLIINAVLFVVIFGCMFLLGYNTKEFTTIEDISLTTWISYEFMAIILATYVTSIFYKKAKKETIYSMLMLIIAIIAIITGIHLQLLDMLLSHANIADEALEDALFTFKSNIQLIANLCLFGGIIVASSVNIDFKEKEIFE